MNSTRFHFTDKQLGWYCETSLARNVEIYQFIESQAQKLSNFEEKEEEEPSFKWILPVMFIDYHVYLISNEFNE